MSGSNLFLTVLILLGAGFQTRICRQWRPHGKNAGLRFVLIFCSAVEALAAHTMYSSRSASASLAIAGSVGIAVLCPAAAYRLGTVLKKRS
jgi:hypothetical protein